MADEVERATGLLNDSYYEGLLSRDSTTALARVHNHLNEVGQALGSDATAGDVMLVTILVDDSLSIKTITRGIEAEEQGHDRLLAVLGRRTEPQPLVHTRLLNGGTFSPYRLLPGAERLSERLRLGGNGTPLYRQTLLTLGSVVAKSRQVAQQSRSVRTVTLLITDGADNASGDTTASDVRFWVRDMMHIARNHIVAGMGIGAGYERVFREMGIPKKFIYEAGATAEDIDAMFDEFEKEILLPSAASAASFAQLLAGSSDEG